MATVFDAFGRSFETSDIVVNGNPWVRLTGNGFTVSQPNGDGLGVVRALRSLEGCAPQGQEPAPGFGQEEGGLVVRPVAVVRYGANGGVVSGFGLADRPDPVVHVSTGVRRVWLARELPATRWAVDVQPWWTQAGTVVPACWGVKPVAGNLAAFQIETWSLQTGTPVPADLGVYAVFRLLP